MAKKKIVLIGYRATGKSTIGYLLSNELGIPFIDLDEYLVKKFGRSIAEVVAENGWEYFRANERKALTEMTKRSYFILACGGGAVLHEKEFSALKKEAIVIWLSACPDTIIKRLQKDKHTKDNRPSLTGKDVLEEIKEVLSYREPLYRKFADLTIETDHLSTKQVVELIKEKILPTIGDWRDGMPPRPLLLSYKL